ncbi:hypothetical protein Tco_0859544 [Tanacetum coccineum]|uniref:Uncharacterized protein n=1 Tax=Tanacetum coccineum TaxID=301880 RepID=A0ABQ5BFD9_9ASTR
MGFTLILATLDGLDVCLLGDVIGEDDCDDDVTTSRYVVPTGRVKVPAGRYVVPTGKDNVIVSAGRTKVIPAGRTILVLVVLSELIV